ncbi:MAG: PASTA domain-containing protein [Bacilli bacterium]|nr:PASTA domain-containing protein [Bacilli bacterium]
MKQYLKKIKQASKPFLITYYIIVIGFVISYIFFARSLISLVGIETTIRYLILGFFVLWFVLYLWFGIKLILKKKKKTFITFSILTFLFIPVFSGVSFIIDKMYNKLENFTIKNTSTYQSVLLTKNDQNITATSKLGMINNENDREGYVLAKEMIEKEQINNEIVPYDDYLIMLNDLYNGNIDGVFVSGDYKILFGNEEKFQKIGDETKIVYSYQKEMKTEESKLTSTKKLTEPFTVLVLGVDSEAQNGLNPNAAFNGDTLMLVTFNPNTLTSTMFSIPRDMYVPIACNHNRYNKINSAAAYGTNCVINTIEQLTDIKVDYFVKVNFKGVVDLVNALGGINVDIETPDYSYDKAHQGLVCEQDSQRRFGEHLVCINPGENVHIDGEQALAYARCRHLYKLSDIARNKHQQAIIEAVAKKIVQVSSFSDFEKLLDTISNNIATNMQTPQILSFYQTIKNMLINSLKGEDFMTIQKTYLEYYGLNVWLPNAGMKTSALGYYPGSLNAITTSMKENLGLIPIETIKTFHYDFNSDKDYSTDVIGKGIRTGTILQLMPNLSGQNVNYAEKWATSHGITLTKEFVESDSIPGIIINQSVHEGTFLKNVSNVTIYISKAKISNPKPTEPEEDLKLPTIPGNPTDEIDKPNEDDETDKPDDKNPVSPTPGIDVDDKTNNDNDEKTDDKD